MSIIVNSTPLISLAIIDQLDLLPKIFKDVIVPNAVYNEVLVDGKDKLGHARLSTANWIRRVDILNAELKRSIMLQLDEGEAEVMTVSKDKNIPLVCIDEFAGRRYAALLGLDVIGTLGVLLIAKQMKLVPAIKPLCDNLISSGRYISRSLYDEVINKAHE